jgi:hypothetical protein
MFKFKAQCRLNTMVAMFFTFFFLILYELMKTTLIYVLRKSDFSFLLYKVACLLNIIYWHEEYVNKRCYVQNKPRGTTYFAYLTSPRIIYFTSLTFHLDRKTYAQNSNLKISTSNERRKIFQILQKIQSWYCKVMLNLFFSYIFFFYWKQIMGNFYYIFELQNWKFHTNLHQYINFYKTRQNHR